MWIHRVKRRSEQSFYKPRFESICIYTYSIPLLERWLRKNYIFVGNLARWGRQFDENGKIKEVTLYLTNTSDRELITKTFGYYDPDYDHLDFVGQLKYKYGQFHNFKTIKVDY